MKGYNSIKLLEFGRKPQVRYRVGNKLEESHNNNMVDKEVIGDDVGSLGAIMHRYFKMSNASCHIVFDALLFMCKIHVLAISIAYLCRIHTVFGNHNLRVFYFKIELSQRRRWVVRLVVVGRYGLKGGPMNSFLDGHYVEIKS